ncbi:hypothetical protein ACIBG6_37850 [Streptomyces sp. NPDC050842]|uniref:hypothetical protein n=1 Tax=Streptomyces sp. NPDC050842 TaxID=3365636 RepID=UPI0037B0EAC9
MRGAYALRTGITRRETAQAWWELNQKLDIAYGLPRDPAPDGTREQTLARWTRRGRPAPNSPPCATAHCLALSSLNASPR